MGLHDLNHYYFWVYKGVEYMKLTGDELLKEGEKARRLRRLFITQEEIEQEELEILYTDMQDVLEMEEEKLIEEMLSNTDEYGNKLV